MSTTENVTDDMVNSHLLRQMSILSPYELDNLDMVHVIGCGGIGGPTALILAKMGISHMNLYDLDHVEPHNLGSQMFGWEDIGKTKVEALSDHIKRLLPKDAVKIDTYNGDIRKRKISVHPEKKTIFILALDSNDTRLEVYENIISKLDPLDDVLIIDPRMGGLSYSIIAKPLNEAIDDFKKYTPKDSDVPDDICTARAISFNTFSIASEIGAIARLWLLGKEMPHIERCMNNCILMDLNNVVCANAEEKE